MELVISGVFEANMAFSCGDQRCDMTYGMMNMTNL